MADYRTGTSAVLLGNKDILQGEIQRLQNSLSTMLSGSPEYNAAITKLSNLKQQLEAEMQKQGATDASGRLLSARDVQDQYLDKDYLNLIRQQTQDEATGALSQGLRAAKQNQLSGNYANIGEVMGQTEAIQRAGNQQLAEDVKSESQRALGEAGTELGRKQSYATQLTEAERSDLTSQISAEMARYNATQAQIQQAQQTMATMPDGFLQQMVGLVGKGAFGGLMGVLTGQTIGVGVGKAFGY